MLPQWLHAHPSNYEWIFTWIKTNPRPPRGFDQTEQTQLHKPGRGPAEAASTWNVQGPMSYPTHVGLSPRKKLIALSIIKEGNQIDKDDASDSDVGMTV